jgi:hypothetical protein
VAGEVAAGEVGRGAGGLGVYEVSRGTDRIIIAVLSQLPLAEHNALWNLFSGVISAVEFGAEHYRPRTHDLSTILNRLFHHYKLEGLDMPYTIEQFRRDALKEILEETPAEELLKVVPVEERLKGLPVEERLKGLPVDVIEAYLRKLKEQEGGNNSGKASPQ